MKRAQLIGRSPVVVAARHRRRQLLPGPQHRATAATRRQPPAPLRPRAGERKVLYWHDPMVPGQRFDKPGKSPFMDMQLCRSMPTRRATPA